MQQRLVHDKKYSQRRSPCEPFEYFSYANKSCFTVWIIQFYKLSLTLCNQEISCNVTTLIVENLQKGLIVANSTHVCNMDIRHITALKDEMTCRVANLTGIMFMAIDIASQWLFYVDSDNHALMQYSLIFNVTTPITEAGPNVTGACVFIYINVMGFFS